MALNFPDPSQSPYVDPVSGLKYVYNTSVGGWEAAIQPPVIVSGTGAPADVEIEGFLYLDTGSSTLYCYRSGQWIPVSSGGGNDGDLAVEVGSIAPNIDLQVQGNLWWDTIGGQLYICYVDADSKQWVPASPTLGAGMNANVITQDTQPAGPVEGDIWFNTSNDVLYVYHDDQWVPTQATTSAIDTITGSSPIVATKTGTTVDVSITQASTTAQGSARYANNNEINNATAVDAALTPARFATSLKTGYVRSYLNTAAEGNGEIHYGVIQLADETEVAAGLNKTKAVTPFTLGKGIGALGTPVGTIIAYAGVAAPKGYLLCDGSQIPLGVGIVQGVEADFTELHGVISTYYAGDGITHLLPDLRGEFLRGWSNGRTGVDAGRQIGSFQLDSAQNPACTSTVSDGSTTTLHGVREESSAVNPDGETRPRNVAILYCIKH